MILIGIGLSMDTFSLSIIYGTLRIKKSKVYLISLIVGLYHFFMPLLGILVGGKLQSFLFINTGVLVFILFLLIGIQMLQSINNKELNLDISLLGILLFGLSVSIDSFTVGIGLEYINDNHLISSSIFMILSSTFTFLGLKLGLFLKNRVFKYSSIIGGLIFIFLAFYYLFFK